METRALFESQFPTLFRYCLRLTGEPDVAEDAAQEAFVRLVRDDVKGSPAALRAWLFRVASNVVRDRYRVRENRRRLMETHATAPETALDPHDSVERGEDVARVRAILDELPERDRTLLLMREEGFAYAEIAAEIGVAPTSIGTLLSRAQSRFAEAFTRSDGAQDHGDPRS